MLVNVAVSPLPDIMKNQETPENFLDPLCLFQSMKSPDGVVERTGWQEIELKVKCPLLHQTGLC